MSRWKRVALPITGPGSHTHGHHDTQKAAGASPEAAALSFVRHHPLPERCCATMMTSMRTLVVILGLSLPAAAMAADAPGPLFWGDRTDAPPGWPHPVPVQLLEHSGIPIGAPVSLNGSIVCTSATDCRLVDDISDPNRLVRFITASLPQATREQLKGCRAVSWRNPCLAVVYGHRTKTGITAEQIRWIE